MSRIRKTVWAVIIVISIHLLPIVLPLESEQTKEHEPVLILVSNPQLFTEEPTPTHIVEGQCAQQEDVLFPPDITPDWVARYLCVDTLQRPSLSHVIPSDPNKNEWWGIVTGKGGESVWVPTGYSLDYWDDQGLHACSSDYGLSAAYGPLLVQVKGDVKLSYLPGQKECPDGSIYQYSLVARSIDPCRPIEEIASILKWRILVENSRTDGGIDVSFDDAPIVWLPDGWHSSISSSGEYTTWNIQEIPDDHIMTIYPPKDC